MYRNLAVAVSALLALCLGCGVYTFSNTALPGHIKTIRIPLFTNETGQPGIADEVTGQLTRQVGAMQQVRIAGNDADATISGRVIAYERRPRTYESRAARDVKIEEYIVLVQVAARFMDNSSNSALFEGMVTGEGIYAYATEDEEVGRARAVEDVVERILQKSMQNW
jgi:hypothetical protein